MAEQLSFAGLTGPGKQTDRLFYAIFPDADAAAHIERIAQRLRAEKGLRGKPLQTDRFHMTLNHLGDYWGLPPSILEPALEAGAKVKAAPFEVALDRVESFRNRPRNRPLVMLGDRDGISAVAAFQKLLGKAMEASGLARQVERRFTPHVTLLYDDHGLREQLLDNQIRWTAREFVLVHSLLGKTQHNVLGRWPLKD
jgi:2'-5' RNA ligase